MSAYDTFEWYVSRMMKKPPANMEQFVKSLREELFTLRSEDERQRFVDQAIAELRQLGIG